MQIYLLTFAGLVALAGVYSRHKSLARGTYGRVLNARLRLFLVAFALIGVIFSVLQLGLAASSNYEATSRTLREVEVRLNRYRAFARLFTFADWKQTAVYVAVPLVLVLATLISSRWVARRRSLPMVMGVYVLAAWLACLALFGSVLAGGILQERIAGLAVHAQRIEERYAQIFEQVGKRLDQRLTAAALSAVKQDEQWLAVQNIWRNTDRDVKQLPVAFPDLFVGATAPSSSSLAATLLPVHVAPLGATSNAPSADPAAARNLKLELFARRFANDPQLASSEDARTARMDYLGAAIAATRARWSEDNASRLEQELGDDVAAADPKSQDLIEALAERVSAAFYEQASDQRNEAPPGDDWTGLPYRYLNAFVAAALDDAARQGVAQTTTEQLRDWLDAKTDWLEAASAVGDAGAVELGNTSVLARQSAQHIFQAAISKAAIEYAIAHAALSEDVRRYANVAFDERWGAVQRAWALGVSRLPNSARESAMRVLARVGYKLQAQSYGLSRVALLNQVEGPWRGVISSLQFEGEGDSVGIVAPAIIVVESVALGSRQFADENRREILASISAEVKQHFNETVGRPPRASEAYKLDAFVGDMFADSAKLTAAAVARLAENVGAQHSVQASSSRRQTCTIDAMLTTTSYLEGFPMSRNKQEVSLPCW